jgi:hypothetical protein
LAWTFAGILEGAFDGALDGILDGVLAWALDFMAMFLGLLGRVILPISVTQLSDMLTSACRYAT